MKVVFSLTRLLRLTWRRPENPRAVPPQITSRAHCYFQELKKARNGCWCFPWLLYHSKVSVRRLAMLPPNFHGDCYHWLRRSLVQICASTMAETVYNFMRIAICKTDGTAKNYFKHVEFWPAYSIFLDMSLKLVLSLSSSPTIYHT